MNEIETTPMVSVVMIAYNSAAYIDRAIAGVVRQKVDFPVELLVMDDCSTDSTPDIVVRWQQRYPDIVRLVRNPANLGLLRNYREGFVRCRGRYVAMCDADDYWCCRTKLRRQVAYMESHPDCAITFHRVINYYEATGEKTLSNGGTPSEISLSQISRQNYITNLSVMYRRELVDLKSLPDWILLDRTPDYAIHMLYAVHGKIHYFSRPMGVYRKVTGSIWSTADRYRQLKMSLSCRKHIIDGLAGNQVAVDGLRAASADIVRAMMKCATTDAERQETAAEAIRFGVDPDFTPATPSAPATQSLKTRIINTILRPAFRHISRLLPLPRP